MPQIWRSAKIFFYFFKILCRASQIWRSAKKIFLFLKYFAECSLDCTRQRFKFFFIISLPSAPVYALGKEEIFKKKLKHSLPSAWWLALGKDTLCRVPCPGTQQSFFVFFVFWPPIFLCSLFKAPGTPSYNLGIFCGFLIYLVTLFRLLEFFWKLEIWTARGTNNGV